MRVRMISCKQVLRSKKLYCFLYHKNSLCKYKKWGYFTFFFAFGLYHEMISCTFLSDVQHFSLIQSLFQILTAPTFLLPIRYIPSNDISKDLIFLNFVCTSNPQNIILYQFICKGKKVIFPLVGIRDYTKIRPYEPVKFQQSAKISSHKFNDSTGVHHSFTYIDNCFNINTVRTQTGTHAKIEFKRNSSYKIIYKSQCYLVFIITQVFLYCEGY